MSIVSAVLTVYNRAQLLERCLWTVCELGSIRPDEIVIVDDASTDDLPHLQYRLPALCRGVAVRYFRRERALGWQNPAIPRNMAIRRTRADADWIWFLEPEMLVMEDTLKKLIYRGLEYRVQGQPVFVNASAQGFCGRTLQGDEWRNPLAVYGAEYTNRREDQTGIRCALCPREGVFAVRGYDEWFNGGVADEEGRVAYSGAGHDDSDFADRLHRAGWKMIYANDIPVVHQWHEAGLWNAAEINYVNVPHMQMNQRLSRVVVNEENWGTDRGRYPI